MESERSLGVKVKLMNGEVVRLPLGFHFHPTESQLVIHYLLPKTLNRQLPNYYVQEISDPFAEPTQLNTGGDEDDDYEYFFSKQSTSLLENYITRGRRWIHVSTKVLTVDGDEEVEVYKAKYLFFDRDFAYTGWKMYVYSLRPIKFYLKSGVRARRDNWVVIRVFHDQLDASAYFRYMAGDEEEEEGDQVDDMEEVSSNIVEDHATHDSQQADQVSRTNPGDVTPSSPISHTDCHLID